MRSQFEIARHCREQLWQLEGEQLRRAQQQLAMIASQRDRALLRLKAHVEGNASVN